jgi:DNA-binding response OmpR family regulator
MYNADAKTLHRIASQLHRVLVVEPSPGSARLAADLVKEMGARQVAMAATTQRALATARDFEPQLILTEYAGPDLDGIAFTTQLRRSGALCRQAPVIMIAAEATAASILAARNSGVHEYLRKPFAAGDLFRRVENVLLKPRPWIEAQAYVGPDRRRFNSGEFQGSRKRRSDGSAPPEALASAS